MSDDPIKDALKMMSYGFYSITTHSGDEVNAMVANWVTQASFTPRMVVVCIAKKAHSHSLITSGKVFTINIFKKDDPEAIKHYSKPSARNPAKMSNAPPYTIAPETGCPVLQGAVAYVECKVTQIVETGGDHDLVVGEVVGAGVNEPKEVTEILTLPDIGWSYSG